MTPRYQKILSTCLVAALLLNAPATGVVRPKASPTITSTATIAPEKIKDKSIDGKEEVVYVNLAADGAVEDVFIVNSVPLRHDTTVLDYGPYAVVKNLSTTDELSVQNGKVTLPLGASGQSLYYQGTLKSQEIPWIIDISYTLDGAPVTAENLKGQDGKLKISIDIQQNRKAPSVYQEHFALQGSVALANDVARNIEAPEATIATSGSNKLLNYIILPGKDKTLTIEAEVENFSMDAMMFSALPLTLTIDNPDTDSLKEKITELQDGAIELDDGAIKLGDGASALDDGATDLDKGADKLSDGAVELSDGAQELKDGADTLTDGAQELQDGVSALYNGTYILSRGSGALEDATQHIHSGAKAIETALASLDDNSQQLLTGTAQLEAGLAQLEKQLPQLSPEQLEIVSLQLQQLKQQLIPVVVEYKTRSYEHRVLQNKLQIDRDNGINDTPEKRAAVLGDSTLSPEEIYTLGIMEGRYQVIDSLLNTLTPALQELSAINALVEQRLGKPMAALDLQEFSATTEELSQGLAALSQGASAVTHGFMRYSGGVNALAIKMKEFTQGTGELRSGATELAIGADALMDGADSLYDGTKELREGTEELRDGTLTLTDGIDELTEGATELKDGTVKLKDGTTELKDGTVELADGTHRLRSETDGMDTTVDEEIEKLLEEYRSDDFTIPSFADDRNSPVQSLQFVIRTPDLPNEEPQAVAPLPPVAQEPKNFWERLIALFTRTEKE